MSDVDDEEDQEVEADTPAKWNRYQAIIIDIFGRYHKGQRDFQFGREEIGSTADRLDLKRPKNFGDVIYTFRYRKPLPKPILDTQPKDGHWLILGAGDARYRFRLSKLARVIPTSGMLVRKIPDATPEIVTRYTLGDEQALLAKIRYNRLIDVFLGIAAYSLQNHLRTKIPNYGQIEIDELYVGIDSRGAQYVVPVQAKGGNDTIGVIQTIQDTVFCQTQKRYRTCIVRPVSAQFMPNNTIAMFELTFDGNDVSIIRERHYRLTKATIGQRDLATYRLSETD